MSLQQASTSCLKNRLYDLNEDLKDPDIPEKFQLKLLAEIVEIEKIIKERGV